MQVLMVERSREDEVLVMASDGLWDVIGNQEAADMAVHSLQVMRNSSFGLLL
jgi:serine/threonine protein phosphatase PrpC